jgi:ectoine hydroxylase-related dioxygenase (phytanoyl-CoA dioxygenase family)
MTLEESLIMEPDKDLTMGVTEQFVPENQVDIHVEEIRRNGYTLLENVLEDEEIGFLKGGILENIYEKQCGEMGGEDKLIEVGDEHSAKALILYDDYFSKLVAKRRIHEVVERFLGDEYKLCLQNAIMNFAGKFNPASIWHRDTPYQHYVSTRPLAITTLTVVDEFNEKTGGTVLLPGSQKHEEYPSADFRKKHSVQVSANPGSVMVFNSMMYHRAGYNKSDNIRRAIVQLFVNPLTEQQFRFAKMLGGRYSDDPFLNKILGYSYGGGPVDSVKEYREERLKMRGGKSGVGYGRIREVGEPSGFLD